MNFEYKISVIIVTYNVSKFIKQSIDSVLKQNHDNCEIIIIDDGSSDSTGEILSSYKDFKNIKIIFNEHSGNVGKLRNDAIKIASGEYIAILDGDDEWIINKLIIQLDYINEYDIICSNAIVLDEFNKVLDCYYFKGLKSDLVFDLKTLLKFNYIITSSVLMKKNICIKAGMFDEIVGIRGEDYILWLNIAKYGKIKYLNKPLIKYRKHPHNLGVHPQNININSIDERIRLLLRTIEIRKCYINHSDSLIVKAAMIGCIGLYYELVKLETRKKNYVKASEYCIELLHINKKKFSLIYLKIIVLFIFLRLYIYFH